MPRLDSKQINNIIIIGTTGGISYETHRGRTLRDGVGARGRFTIVRTTLTLNRWEVVIEATLHLVGVTAINSKGFLGTL